MDSDFSLVEKYPNLDNLSYEFIVEQQEPMIARFSNQNLLLKNIFQQKNVFEHRLNYEADFSMTSHFDQELGQIFIINKGEFRVLSMLIDRFVDRDGEFLNSLEITILRQMIHNSMSKNEKEYFLDHILFNTHFDWNENFISLLSTFQD